jgi:hypothetical protein
MKRVSVISVLVATAAGLIVSVPSRAQSDKLTLPPGAVEWQYECKGGDCPTRCAMAGTELFSTGSFSKFTIVQFPNQSVWFRISTEATSVDYIYFAPGNRGDQVVCSMGGAALTSFRGGEAGQAAQRP